jgi:thiosulfate dehydrogenase [quinone] large subunit
MDVVNFLVVFGQIAIGIALILGIATRFAAFMGTLMMMLFFFAAWEFEHGIVNQHLTYALVTATIGYLGAGRVWGLDGVLERTILVVKAPALRYLLG